MANDLTIPEFGGRDVSLPKDGNGEAMLELRLGILSVKTVAVAAGATQLVPAPPKGARKMTVYLAAGGPLTICDSYGNVAGTLTTTSPFVRDAVGTAMQTYYALGGAPTNAQVTIEG